MKDYPFKKQNDEQAHLDNEENRHKIQTRESVISRDFAGQEHLYCDPSQLDANGKWIDPHAPAKARGFKSMMEMYEADKKKAGDDKAKETDDLKKQVADLTALVQQLLKK
jgi:hypothetical protein